MKFLAAIPRFVVRIATALGVLSAVAAVAATIDPQWIESLFEVSPDGGSGESELGLAVAFGAAAVILLGGAFAAVWAHRHLDGSDSTVAAGIDSGAS